MQRRKRDIIGNVMRNYTFNHEQQRFMAWNGLCKRLEWGFWRRCLSKISAFLVKENKREEDLQSWDACSSTHTMVVTQMLAKIFRKVKQHDKQWPLGFCPTRREVSIKYAVQYWPERQHNDPTMYAEYWVSDFLVRPETGILTRFCVWATQLILQEFDIQYNTRKSKTEQEVEYQWWRSRNPALNTSSWPSRLSLLFHTIYDNPSGIPCSLGNVRVTWRKTPISCQTT